MKAMILAAGKGTRVRPITYTIPKPLIPILQKPVMEFLLELLRQAWLRPNHGERQPSRSTKSKDYFRRWTTFWGATLAILLKAELLTVSW